MASLVLALTLALTACGTGVTVADPDLTLHGAKAIAQEGERDIVALIPDELIISVDQRPTGSLLSCTGQRNYQWAGGTTVTVIPDTDLDAIVDDIAHAYKAKEPWTVTRRTESAGYPKYLISHPHAASYVVSAWTDPDQVNIYSFSPCFHLPDDMTPHGSY
ncbi:MAG: hypothetical protein P0Y48_06850 [Candidatus Microbacterium phytovorans]|uniref:Lipoprotein n=1 Tax=Candidatus Microbacterium phytovorans TaxID=3121374 RepID=A0AAJ6B4Y3_9MICO|nr:hypothetical protein [Microbacterium sp.]WEK14902.1 MAG: hypothetical protein P0Y48_06850 [Microbacterium sp.]